ncbi:MAG: RdgB/HAM1 family non-canonical purine NTP pyrophosphatase [Bacteroidales bacterium]|nr:RdgB/HAM1 family non-canonical purine NTP pyrophosphatase [Bacteroidales bacterium]
MEIIFATNNSHKLFEVNEKLRLSNSDIRIISLTDIGFSDEIPETGTTLKENALQKSQTVYDFITCRGETPLAPTGVFADDSGLEIEALNGEPGVNSAHYAGEPRSSENNIHLVLSKMQGKVNRRACFKTVIALILDGNIHYFEGRVAGEITTEKYGTDGFGYDPIFRPDGYSQTFAELTLDEKNKISHRGRAVNELINFLLMR